MFDPSGPINRKDTFCRRFLLFKGATRTPGKVCDPAARGGGSLFWRCLRFGGFGVAAEHPHAYGPEAQADSIETYHFKRELYFIKCREEVGLGCWDNQTC